MGRRNKVKKLKANKKAKEGEIKIHPNQQNENYFEINAEENSSAPAAEDVDSDMEISAEDWKKLEENFYRKRSKEVDLIIQNLREVLISEQTKLKHIGNMQKEAGKKLEVMESMYHYEELNAKQIFSEGTYEKYNENKALLEKMKSALAINRFLIGKMKEGNEKVKSIIGQIKDVVIKYNEHKERIKEINKLKKEVMENYEQIFKNNKELTRSSETVIELEEAQTFFLVKKMYPKCNSNSSRKQQ